MPNIDSTGALKDQFQNFIALSRYARWRDDVGRRETWTETVDRYVEFFRGHLSKNYGYDAEDPIFKEVREAILTHRVMPSMRALMTAGPALKRNNIAGYNCSFIAVEYPQAFSEAMLILLCGTGVGFSVERKYVDQLPTIPALRSSDVVIEVADSKEGWVDAFTDLLTLMYAGEIPSWDLSQIRPAGARLKTFGGRASGPGPLDRLFRFTVDTFKAAEGRRLSPLEAHDLMCVVGDVVVSGGVRRSALISLSDLGEFEMAKAKSGSWWEQHGHRALANNSAAYYEKPSPAQFLREWRNLIESQSGERGIVNIAAMRKHADASGRDGSRLSGTNPSLVAGTRVWTTDGVVPIEDLEGASFKTRTGSGVLASASCWKSGENVPVMRVQFGAGTHYTATPQHKWPTLTPSGVVRKRTDELVVGDVVQSLRVGSVFPEAMHGTRDEGFVIGWNLADGWQTLLKSGATQYGFIVADGKEFAKDRIERVLAAAGARTSFVGKGRGEINVNAESVGEFFERFGAGHKSTGLPTAVWSASVSDEFRLGLLDALFSADGSVESGGRRARLHSSHEALVHDVADLLGLFGIRSTIQTRSILGSEAFPGHPAYAKSDKEFVHFVLTVGDKRSLDLFARLVAVSHPVKAARLAERSYTRAVKERGMVVTDVRDAGTADVWDVAVDHDDHSFQLPRVVTGNCGEILLRDTEFCNLSEVVVSPKDTMASLKEKIRLAAIIGTWQSTLTKFPGLRTAWKRNCEEERLLGVSLTGIYGNSLLNDPADPRLPRNLEALRREARVANEEEAHKIGVNSSAAVTCVKPSGTVSQLVGVSSGIHPWFSEHYVRTVRGPLDDPLSRLMMDSGVPHEPDVMKPDSQVVFSFPVSAPSGAVTRDEVSALDHLGLWRTYRTHFTDHNPSVTINVRDDEWMDVGAWVYRNWDDVGGLSFLPYSDHVYAQAPYQPVPESDVAELAAAMPKVRWADLAFYETADGTTGSQELACSAGDCEVVDIVS